MLPTAKHQEENVPKLRKDLEWLDKADSDGFVREDGPQIPRSEKIRLKPLVCFQYKWFRSKGTRWETPYCCPKQTGQNPRSPQHPYPLFLEYLSHHTGLNDVNNLVIISCTQGHRSIPVTVLKHLLPSRCGGAQLASSSVFPTPWCARHFTSGKFRFLKIHSAYFFIYLPKNIRKMHISMRDLLFLTFFSIFKLCRKKKKRVCWKKM